MAFRCLTSLAARHLAESPKISATARGGGEFCTGVLGNSSVPLPFPPGSLTRGQTYAGHFFDHLSAGPTSSNREHQADDLTSGWRTQQLAAYRHLRAWPGRFPTNKHVILAAVELPWSTGPVDRIKFMKRLGCCRTGATHRRSNRELNSSAKNCGWVFFSELRGCIRARVVLPVPKRTLLKWPRDRLRYDDHHRSRGNLARSEGACREQVGHGFGVPSLIFYCS